MKCCVTFCDIVIVYVNINWFIFSVVVGLPPQRGFLKLILKHAAFISRSYFLNFFNNHKVKVLLFNCVQLFATPWTVACQAPLSMEVQARILEWVAIPFSRGSSRPRVKPRSLALQADSLLSEPPGKSQIFIFPIQMWPVNWCQSENCLLLICNEMISKSRVSIRRLLYKACWHCCSIRVW